MIKIINSLKCFYQIRKIGDVAALSWYINIYDHGLSVPYFLTYNLKIRPVLKKIMTFHKVEKVKLFLSFNLGVSHISIFVGMHHNEARSWEAIINEALKGYRI